MKKPLVSISCITFNHEPFIQQCIEGFLMQEGDFEYEVLIHDDASTDKTQEIIKKYQKKYPDVIKPIFQTDNQYSTGVRQFNSRFNFPRAKGEYIALCDGDDYWSDPLKLQKQINFLERNPDTVLCAHEIDKVDSKGNIIKKGGLNHNLIEFERHEILNDYFSPLSLVFRNVPLDYNHELKKAFNGDIVLLTLLSCYGKAAKFGFVGGSYRIHKGGVYSEKDIVTNAVKSIQTRRILIKYANLDKILSHKLKKDIRRRKFKAIKNSFKKLKIKAILKIIFT